MKATVDVLEAEFSPQKANGHTYYSFKFGNEGQYELTVEPTLIAGILEVALYERGELMTEDKLPVKAVLRGVDVDVRPKRA